MVRYWCDHCGKEVQEHEMSIVSRACLEGKPFHLCPNCKNEWDKIESKYWEKECRNSNDFNDTCVEFLTRIRG